MWNITRSVRGGLVIAGARGAGGKSELRRAGCRVTPGEATHGKCNRKQTAFDSGGKGERVR